MSFRWWMPLALAVGIAALANLVLIGVAWRVHPGKVEAHPYASSAQEDAHLAAQAAFAARGWSLHCATDAGGVTLRLEAPSGAKPDSASIDLYRPDDERLDRMVPWADPAQAVHLDLPRPGLWELHLTLHDQAGTVLTHNQRVMRP